MDFHSSIMDDNAGYQQCHDLVVTVSYKETLRKKKEQKRDRKTNGNQTETQSSMRKNISISVCI